MAISTIHVGNIANDGTGDDLREAFIKVNDNFTEVINNIDTLPITAENLGISGKGIFAAKNDNVLQFKELLAGSNIKLSSNNNSIIIDSDGGLDGIDILLDNGSIDVDGSEPLKIIGGNAIKTRKGANKNLIIDLADKEVVESDTNPKLSSSLDANNNNINNANSVNANSFNGPLSGLVYGIDIRDINKYFSNNWDFGEIIPEFNNIIDYIVFATDVDMGSFVSEEPFGIDLGKF